MVKLKMVMVAGHGEAWQAVFLSLPYNSGATCGAAPDGGAGKGALPNGADPDGGANYGLAGYIGGAYHG